MKRFALHTVSLGLCVIFHGAPVLAADNPEVSSVVLTESETQRLEGVFLAVADDLSLYFSLESGADGVRFRRRAEFVWTDAEGQLSRVYEDVANGRPWQGTFPAPPAEMPVEALSDGSLLMSFPAPAEWENRLQATARRATHYNERPRVADGKSARLLIITQFEGVAPQLGQHDAVLYGTQASVEGTVWLRTDVAKMVPAADEELSSSSWVVWRGRENIQAQNLPKGTAGLAHHFVLGVTAGCERSIPQSLLVTLPEPARLVTSSEPSCFSSGKSVSRATGVRLKDNAAAEIRGLVIWR